MEFKSTKEERLAHIYRSYAVDVYHACLYLTKYDEALSEDMMQQAFLNFYEADEDVKPECVKAYLIRIARNLIYNYYRKAKRTVLECEFDEVNPILEESTESVEDFYMRGEHTKEVEELCSKILAEMKAYDEDWYEVFYRRYYLEKSYEEIAEELNITRDVLYSRLYRAKLWVRKKYGLNVKRVVNGAS
ncbi:MAG: sigma-70 family RNA polymerase sigma factor [Faecalimonas sp.]|nr:sigma-70 family RNA polymerase sigma factor [Faecalimonas sp.]